MLSTLTAEQKNKLQTLLSGLELAADIAHARVTIYLSDNDKKFLQVLKQVQPLTQRGKVQPDLTGRKVYCICNVCNPGGMERVLLNKVRYLVEVMHWDVTVVTTDQKGRPPFYAFPPQVRMLDLPTMA